VNTLKLQNNTTLKHFKTDKFNTANIAVLIRRRLNRDEVTKNALIPMILKRGCEKHPDFKSLTVKTEDMHGALFDTSVIKKGEEQLLQFYIEVNNDTESLNDGLEFLSEVMLHLLVYDGGFDEGYTETEKENLRRQIADRPNDKREYAKNRCLEEMCRDEPFGIYGDGYAEDIDALNAENLYAHYVHMLQNSPILFFVTGKTETNELAEKIDGLFNFETNIRRVSEHADVAQGKLCIGIRTDVKSSGDGFYALLCANEILGGGPDSRLFSVLREKESLCYYASSFVYRFKSIIMIESGLNATEYDKAVDIIKYQLEELKNGGIGEDELQKAKTGLVKRLRSIFDDGQAMLDFYLSQQLLTDGDLIDDATARINGLTAQDCTSALANARIDTIYFLANENKTNEDN